jgi:hypothetical protein
MNELREQGFVAESVDHFGTLADTIMEAHRHRGGQGAPKIAVIEVPKVAEDNQLAEIVAADNELMPAIGYLLERGCQFQLCDVSAVRLSGNRLVLDDFEIDYVFLADETDRYLETCPPDAPLLVALQQGTVALADGPPLGGIYNDKALFADLSERASGLVLPDDVADAVDRSVPWTRRCKEGPTTYDGRAVDLVPFLVENREKLVLKPANSYAGKNVSLGWELAPEAWASAVTDALRMQSFIVQERVVGDRTRMSLLGGDATIAKDVYFDIDPLVWGGRKASGAVVRISSAALLNVSAGTGSATAVFVVDARR